MRFFILFCCVVVSACNPPADRPVPVLANACDSCPKYTIKANTAIWFIEYDGCEDAVLTRGNLLDSVHTIDAAIERLNSQSGPVQLERVRTNGDTLYVRLVNGEHYTQRMGTTGANHYMLSMLYTLTDHFGYNVVHFDFTEGDHGGQPGFRDRGHHGAEQPKRICP